MITKIINNLFFSFLFFKIIINRVIHKVKKTQHQNPESGHTRGEIQKKLEKKYISIQGGWNLENHNFCGKLSFILSFLVPERLHSHYIYFPCPTCIATIN
jgi:hypothetical protein